jgi:hypothetical protein
LEEEKNYDTKVEKERRGWCVYYRHSHR